MADAVIAPVPSVNLQRVFLKGQSFEMPGGAQLFIEQGQLQMELNLAINSQLLTDDVYEVSLRGTLTARLGDKVQFLAELDQAGIFEIKNLSADDTVLFIETVAPGVIAPYLRSALSEVLSRATLPGFYLPEVNWQAMHNERVAASAAAEAATGPIPALLH